MQIYDFFFLAQVKDKLHHYVGCYEEKIQTNAVKQVIQKQKPKKKSKEPISKTGETAVQTVQKTTDVQPQPLSTGLN